MVYGVMISKDERFYTYLRKLFTSMDNIQLNYKWLISHYECWPQDQSIKDLLLDKNHVILDGAELTNIADREDFQWIWGTFSAFDKSVPNDEILKHILPENDLYEGFWKLPLTIQHPLAKMEIVAFDSSYTLVLTRDFSLLDVLRKTYPNAEDLAVINKNS